MNQKKARLNDSAGQASSAGTLLAGNLGSSLSAKADIN
jgi:hypothetical protein